jgi:WS/DGAT/MGAT family acyltransferase
MSQRELTRRLTNIDAAFLYMEKPTQPAHIGGCTVYEGDLTREVVAGILLSRLHRLPRYRQRVVFPPFGLAHPTWEDDPDFDIEKHIDEVTLQEPGDDAMISEVGGRAYAGMLDRERPLWKLILLRGHQGGRTAMVWKIHHAMVDGVSGVDLSMVLHDLKPDVEPPAPPVAWQPPPLPDPMSLLQDAVRDRLTETAQAWTDDVFGLLRPGDTSDRVRPIVNAVTSSMPSLLQPAPRVPFNGPLSVERRFSWVELPFAAVRSIRSALGGTVNDVVLAIIAGGFGRYLRQHGQPTQGVELRAMCPVSMRRPDERGALGNLVSIIIAPLYVGIADPVERLAAERTVMDRLKTDGQADGLYSLTQLANRIPPGLQAFVGQLNVPNTILNTVSTNIPGPQIPLYLAGRKLVAWYPLGLLASDIGVFNAILSYNQTLTIAATVDPHLMADPWFYADCLKASFGELLEAAEGQGRDEREGRGDLGGPPDTSRCVR